MAPYGSLIGAYVLPEAREFLHMVGDKKKEELEIKC